MRYCPSDIYAEMNTIMGSRQVQWTEPIFVGANNHIIDHACNIDLSHMFTRGQHRVVCYPKDYPSLICNFIINVTGTLYILQ